MLPRGTSRFMARCAPSISRRALRELRGVVSFRGMRGATQTQDLDHTAIERSSRFDE
jgi:hypothetical protein